MITASPEPPTHADSPNIRRGWHARARMLVMVASAGVLVATLAVWTLPPSVETRGDPAAVVAASADAVTATIAIAPTGATAITSEAASLSASAVASPASAPAVAPAAAPAAAPTPAAAPAEAKAAAAKTVSAVPTTASSMPTKTAMTPAIAPAAKATVSKTLNAKPVAVLNTCSALVAAAQYKDAVASCTKEADAGNAPSQRRLGLLLSEGHGVKRDDSEAAQWFSEAANGGDAESMFLFAQRLEKGRGVKVDVEGAVKWYQQAATNGVAAAMYTVGDIYEHGKLGVKLDRDRALEAYRKAAEKHYRNAASKVRALSH